jgi:hypothetical protein
VWRGRRSQRNDLRVAPGRGDVDARGTKTAAAIHAEVAGEVTSQHLFIGSGVIEAGCKTVIGYRLKQSGMFWTIRGANAIIALRCCHLNGRFETYWEERRAA